MQSISLRPLKSKSNLKAHFVAVLLGRPQFFILYLHNAANKQYFLQIYYPLLEYSSDLVYNKVIFFVQQRIILSQKR